ncbi:MAG TPA: T9SS type A sorting domain-containing protein [Chitinophagaceae bacterium]|nr:T9SS type A sorting domain-containing protein [Chitinophagaceae bacterium]
MKKNLTLLLIAFASIFQTLNAQTNPALVNNFTIDNDLSAGYRLSWTVANNEVVSKFELQKSVNGSDFNTIAVLNASIKSGAEIYAYNETTIPADKVMYRLKMLSKGFDTYYSRILLFQPKRSTDKNIKIIGNPVNDKLTLSFNLSSSQQVDLKIYSVSGNIVFSQKVNSPDRGTTIIIPLSSTFKTGMYVVEINNGIGMQTAGFVKQ